jgi:hypothetical protein
VKQLPRRHVALLIAALAVACLATWTYAYGLHSDECAESLARADDRWIEGVEPDDEQTQRPPPWAFQTVERLVPSEIPGVTPPHVRILRTYQPDKLYGNAKQMFPPPDEFAPYLPQLEWVDAGAERLPVRKVVATGPGSVRVGAYLFLYDSRAVPNPALALLGSAAQRLTTGPRPLTLVTVSVYAQHRFLEEAHEVTEASLVSIWDSYRTACRQ